MAAGALLFPLMGRLSMSAAVCLFAYARPGAGMGRAYAQETGQRDLAVAVVISLLIVVVVCGYIKPSSKEVSIILVAAALSLGGPYLLARRIAAKLGGLTGMSTGLLTGGRTALSAGSGRRRWRFSLAHPGLLN